MNITPEERETHLNMTGDDHNQWIAFTDDPIWMRRLDRVAEFIRVVGAGKEYRLDANQVTIKTKPKPLSAERKAQLADQARLMRKNLVATSDSNQELDAPDGNEVE